MVQANLDPHEARAKL